LVLRDQPDLDYYRLLKEARAASERGGRPLRVGLLADFSCDRLGPLLAALFARGGVQAEVHCGGFGAMAIEARDPGSALHRFAPDLVVLGPCTQALRVRHALAGDREALAHDVLEELSGVWAALSAARPVPIVQANLARPHERVHGSFGLGVPTSLESVCAAVNRGLVERAAAAGNVFVADVEGLAASLGTRRFFDERLWAVGKLPCALEFLPHLAQCLVDVALAIQGCQVKCVVVDLDNTLWGGILAEDGIDGLEVGQLADGAPFARFQHFLLELRRRGILLAVCSKNDEATARQALREQRDMVLREDAFAVLRANYADKASNLAAIREALGISLDSMVFLDDSPFERNLVRELLPQVIVPELPEDPAEYLRCLADLNLFETASRSALDERRGELVADEQRREADRERHPTVEGYLASLQMRAGFLRFDAGALPRIAQLLQRSNQFNLATRRFTQGECQRFLEQPERYVPVYVPLRDRFGDLGIVSVAVLRIEGEVLGIEEYVMSCRVLQRGLEHFVANHVFATARRLGLRRVEGIWRPTLKNALVRDLYSRLGFALVEELPDGSLRYAREVESFSELPCCIEAEPGSLPERLPAAVLPLPGR
jgi:FkbH-like protein